MVFEIREKEYGQDEGQVPSKGCANTLGVVLPTARAIMDNFTNEAKTTGCIQKRRRFLLFSFERDFFFDKKKMCVSTRFLHLLRVVLLLYYDSYSYACEAVSTTTSARALLAKHHVVFQTDPGGSYDESTGGIGDVAFPPRFDGGRVSSLKAGVEHFLRPL